MRNAAKEESLGVQEVEGQRSCIKFHLCHLQAVCFPAKYLTSLGYSFPICNMRVIILSAPKS